MYKYRWQDMRSSCVESLEKKLGLGEVQMDAMDGWGFATGLAGHCMVWRGMRNVEVLSMRKRKMIGGLRSGVLTVSRSLLSNLHQRV